MLIRLSKNYPSPVPLSRILPPSKNFPCPLSLSRAFFLWESKLVDREQGRYTQKASAGKEFPKDIRSCFRKVRRAYRAPGRAPLHRNNPVLAQSMACPPGPENAARLMIFAWNALASGPGNA